MSRTNRERPIDPVMDQAVARLREAAPVEKVILFGSRARGDAVLDSDWDICVLLSDDIPPGRYTPSVMWHAIRDLDRTIQVVPMRLHVFESSKHDVNALAYDIAREGIVLYDSHVG
jgi:predicted nucleotidyltransferase